MADQPISFTQLESHLWESANILRGDAYLESAGTGASMTRRINSSRNWKATCEVPCCCAG
jgi:hypothetical protein